MCGIVGYIGTEQAAPILLEGLSRLEYRGYDSAGVAVFDALAGALAVRKAKGRLQVLSEQLHGGVDLNSTVGVGHTRWATHGAPSDINSHPQVSRSGRIAVVHNGIIENYAELKAFLMAQGVPFTSETDTEVVAQLIEYFYEGDLLATVGRVLHRIQGAYALGILRTGNVNTSLYDRPDTTRELYRDLPSKTLSLFERSYHWLEEYMQKCVSPGKVWLEAYPTAWFFFHNHLNLLSGEDSLIVIDKFPETLLAYKAVIEQQDPRCKILYIADASTSPPLQKKSIDCCMDFFAVNEYNFYHDGLFLSKMIPYFKRNVELFGVYFFFQNGRKSVAKYLDSYPQGTPANFNIHWFMEEMKKDFCVLETLDCGSSLDSGQNLGLGFHVPGEELHLQPYHAKMNDSAAGS